MESAAFRYRCRTCGEWHTGVPALAVDAPATFYAIPEAERASRCELTSDTCVIDDQFFFVRGNIDIAVEGMSEPFQWGVWASLGRSSFESWIEHFEHADRADYGPYFGWLSSLLENYPDTQNLKTMVHVAPLGFRPKIELEPTDHPLAIEQRVGITQARLAEILSHYLH